MFNNLGNLILAACFDAQWYGEPTRMKYSYSSCKCTNPLTLTSKDTANWHFDNSYCYKRQIIKALHKLQMCKTCKISRTQIYTSKNTNLVLIVRIKKSLNVKGLIYEPLWPDIFSLNLITCFLFKYVLFYFN